ncbi:MAG TPA: calcium-binding protein [Allosphingosinicella sp.]|nr:calcium-binding protein [Allosphingosinicella sp.]
MAIINGTPIDDTIRGTAENDILYGHGGSDVIEGGAGDDDLYGGDGNDILRGQEGADRMYGGAGSDLFFVDDTTDQVFEEAAIGWDIVYTTLSYYALPENVESLRYVGNAFFFGSGNSGDNVLQGGAGDDTLDGREGADRMIGGLGDDFYWVNNVGDEVVEQAGEGYETIVIAGGITAYTLPANVERMVFAGLGNFQLYGNALDNILEGGAGNDILQGYAGADWMEGSTGNDLYFVDNIGDTVVELANEGIDTLRTTLSAYSLPTNVENLVYMGPYDVSFSGTGNALDNSIDGGDAADYIDGGAGADRMAGRGGNDVYIVDHVGDQVVEFPNGGVDEVRTALGSRNDHSKMYILPDRVENLTGTSSTGQGVYGNALDNLIKMGAGGDLVVLQDGGVDTVFGGGGNDFIYFGNALTVEDSVDGGAGFDTVGLLGSYDLTFAANNLVGIEKLAVYGSGPGFLPNKYKLTTVDANVGSGQTLMVAGLSLGEGESLTFDGSAETDGRFSLYGGKGVDALTGGAGRDILVGNFGADTLRGGGGNDMFEYRNALESTRTARDQILDFSAGDKIDLWNIDADNNAANGNSQFSFIGTGAFSYVAGQLRAVNMGGQWLVEADTNGDASADLSILVTTIGGHIIGASDFIL